MDQENNNRQQGRVKIPEQVDAGADQVRIPARESWRVFGIIAEFVEGTERLPPCRERRSMKSCRIFKP